MLRDIFLYAKAYRELLPWAIPAVLVLAGLCYAAKLSIQDKRRRQEWERERRRQSYDR